MDDTQDIFEIVNPEKARISAVHTNSHNHALVENPFAWEDDQDETEED